MSLIKIHWMCNQCETMWKHGAMPEVCTCGNDMRCNSTKKKWILMWDIVQLIDKHSEYVYTEIEGDKHINSLDLKELKETLVREKANA